MNLKIMYFLDDGQGFGGAAHTLLRQAVLMRNAGHKVLLVLSDYRNETISKEYADICAGSSMEIHHLPFRISSQPEDLDIIAVIESYQIVRDAVKEFNPDILHSIQINPVVELVSRELKIPHIMNIYQVMKQFFSIQYMDVFPRYHICDSWYYANIWKECIHTDSVCIRTVADRPLQTRISEKDNKKIRYCCVGGIYTRKNQLEVIKAFRMALSEGLQGELFLYGYDLGSYADKCRKYLQENKLSESIRMAGFCSNMDAEYEKADVLLCGSVCESYPNVISEALAHGLTIISTPVAGVPEVIKDGYNGYLCDGYSAEAIYRKIRQFNEDRNRGRTIRISENAARTYQETHAPESVGSELIKYYSYVLENTPNVSQIGISDLEDAFTDIIRLYKSNYNAFDHNGMVQLKLWYIYHIKKILEKLISERQRKAYIWGAGRLAKTVKTMVEIFFPFLPVEGFIDSHRQDKLFDLNIYSPEKALQEPDMVIFVGVMNGQEEILQVMQEHSKTYNQDYFVLAPRVW